MTRLMFRTHALVFLLFAAGLSLPGVAQSQLPDPVFPGLTGWEIRDPDLLGMDAAKLLEAKTYAESKQGAGLIVRRGYQVYSWG
ncbi:MAG TPA: hypothetical protein VJ011_11770, partial [Steroidobacteraceae bacterium]|nr:hypothetical protein [Steroidobacteraceae bacterium]